MWRLLAAADMADPRSCLTGPSWLVRYSSLFLELGAGTQPGRHAGQARFVPSMLGRARVHGEPMAREGSGGDHRLDRLDLLRDTARVWACSSVG